MCACNEKLRDEELVFPRGTIPFNPGAPCGVIIDICSIGCAVRHLRPWHVHVFRRGGRTSMNVVTPLRATMLVCVFACAPRTRQAVEPEPSSLVTPALVATGDSLFHARACRRCHGMQGAGTRNGPTLTDSTWLQIDGSYSEIVRIITEGVPMARIKDATHTLEMHPRGGLQNPLSDAQVRAIAAYVYSLRLRA